MSGLGVLADHHCSVCVPLPITRQRRIFCLLGCRGTLFLLWSGFFLSPYLSWHAPNGSNSAYLFWIISQPSRTPPRKSLSRNLKNKIFPSPHHQTMPFESLTPNLTMPCIGWVQAGGAWALRVPSFHMCPKSVCCLFVYRGLEASLHNLPYVFLDLLCGLLFDFPFLLGAGPYL